MVSHSKRHRCANLDEWRLEGLDHRCMPSFGCTLWSWITEKGRLTRDDPGKVVRKIVEREYEAEGRG